jgi:uncharacterized protein
MIVPIRLSYLVLLCASLMTVQQAWAGAVEDARVAYLRKDYSTALSLWRPLAEQGNAEAQRGLGILYENGRAVAKDEKLATDLFRKAALGGDTEAEYRLGLRLVMGTDDVARDTVEGLNWLVKSGEQGRPNSLTRIGDIYRSGRYGLEKNLAQATSWFRKAADLGDPEGQAWLGWAYHYGMGVPKDTNEAVAWLTKAGERGYTPAQMELGELFEQGDEVTINKPKALCWYRKVNTGSPSSQAIISAKIARLESEVTTSVSATNCD